MPDLREMLAQQQAELLQALDGAAPAPAGFDASRVAAAGEALLRKRRRALARAWPILRESLGERFGGLFGEYAAERSLPAEGGPLADGYAFADWLAARGELSDEACRERMGVYLGHVPTDAGLTPRRWPVAAIEQFPQSRRLLFAGVWPGGWWFAWTL